jgi:hypothetical protein
MKGVIRTHTPYNDKKRTEWFTEQYTENYKSNKVNTTNNRGTLR